MSKTPFSMALYMKRRKVQLRRKGMCIDCGTEKRAKGHSLCEDCMEHRRLNYAVRGYLRNVTKITDGANA